MRAIQEIGAAFEVTSLQGEHCKRIKEELADSPSEELFLPLQQEAYGIMLFDLFPRFWEAVKEQDMISKKKGTTLTADTNLSDVLAVRAHTPSRGPRSLSVGRRMPCCHVFGVEDIIWRAHSLP